ncbi:MULTISPECIES: MAPEG family protein [unclassified Phenylobacterium]|uniref:MAPEG family protein n=1 Tax=unclassified Phenylobacterium TaxID=2640670 RepID=UPI00083B7EC4|nr:MULTISPECIES: MAPEG family protein [unclassified Phenylobacterium]
MSIEFWCLYAAMGLALVHLTAASFSFKAQVGNAYTVGARDEDLRPKGVAGRLGRAQRNFLETFAIFAAAVLMLDALDRAGGWLSVSGAVTYVAGRSLFLPLYAAGIPWLRTLSWNAATAGLVMVMIAVVWTP